MWVLGCTSNIFLIHKKIENWDFSIQLIFVLSDCEDSASLVCVQERGSQFVIKLPVFNKMNFNIYETNVCQLCWEYCFQA